MCYAHFLCLLLLTCRVLNAQPDLPAFRFEAGPGFGAMNCLTDLGNRNAGSRPPLGDIDWSRTRGSACMYANIRYRQVIGVQGTFSYGTLTANDGKSGPLTGPAARSWRNLSFRSRITELALTLELRIYHKWWYADEGTEAFTVSLAGGIGLYHFNPTARLDHDWINLHRLRLEGQGFAEYPDSRRYSLSQLNLPIGLLVSRSFWNGLDLGVELNYRCLFTDFLDDVSGIYIDPSLFSKYLDERSAALARRLQFRTPEILSSPVPVNRARGNPTKNDAYFTMVLKIGVTL